MSQLKTLMVHSTNPSNAVSYYRSVGEIFKLRKLKFNNLDVQVCQNIEWWQLRYADALMMERPYKEEHVSHILHAKALGMKVWVDYDDFLFGVPSDNPCFKLYQKEDTRANVAQAISLADYVTFSTEFLRDAMGDKNNPNHIVVNNGLACDQGWVDRTWSKDEPKEKVVLWRGSNTHVRDLMAHSRGLVEASMKHPDWQFVFVGYQPWFITDYLPNWQFAGGFSVDDYFVKLVKRNPALVVVPLVDCPFNRAKSNIAGLEGNWLCNSNVLGPDFDEWRQPGWLTYNDPLHFGTILDHYMETGYDQKKADLGRNAIKHLDNFSDGVPMLTRTKILTEMINGLELK